MIKYAKILNDETGLVEVGFGDDFEFYQSIGMEEMDVSQSDIDDCWYLTEKVQMKTQEQKEQEEKERIKELFMTRSDFFDGTIRAFGLDGDSLLQIIIAYFAQNNDYDELEEKIAINNFKNALNFYRKYPLFDMLSGKELPISETQTILITSGQWDKFFNETNKKNPEAWKELLPTAKETNEEQ